MDLNEEYNIDDEIIKVYLEVYLNAMEAKKDPKAIDIIQKRMMLLGLFKKLTLFGGGNNIWHYFIY